MSRSTSLVAALFFAAMLAPTDASADCPDARERRLAGDPTAAVEAAQTCLEATPTDADSRIELARALAALEKYGQAREELAGLLQAEPDHLDARLLRIRILGWSGEFGEARAELDELPEEAFEDPDTARLKGDLAFWDHDWAAAVRAYDKTLALAPDGRSSRRNRAIARWKSGDVERGRRELKRLCGDPTNDEAACAAMDDLRAGAHRFQVFFQPGWEIVEGAKNGWSLRTRIDARIWREIKLGTQLYALNRTYGAGDAVEGGTDLYWEFFGSARLPVGFLIDAAIGYSGDPIFSPRWNLKIEPGWAFDFGLEARLLYWRIDFGGAGGAHVLAPSVAWYVGPVYLYLRYYLSFDDDEDRGIGNSVIARVAWTFVPRWTASLVGGVGDRSDFLDTRRSELDSFWLLGGGIAWEPIAAIKISLDYEFRGERASADRRRAHLLLLGTRFRF